MATALLLVDIQNDYFPGYPMALAGIEAAASNAAKVLAFFRARHWPVFHVQHVRLQPDAQIFALGTKGVEIHDSVHPGSGEQVVVKHFANSFRETGLRDLLDQAGVTRLVICGAMSHMCVDAATRAAADFGYDCIVVHDACATRDLTFNGVDAPAASVHAAMMAALAWAYAKVVSAEELAALLPEEA